MRLLVAALGLAALSACVAQRPAPTPTPVPRTTPAPDAECSAARLSAELPEPTQVPPATSITRRAIADAAAACDYLRLEELARTPDRFTYSLDEPDRGRGWDPAGWWREREETADEVLALMVHSLNARVGEAVEMRGDDEVVRMYVWPRAVDPGDTVDTDWEDVARLHTVEQADEWRRRGVYHGWRLGITDEGRWIFFVTGNCAEATRRPVDPRLCP